MTQKNTHTNAGHCRIESTGVWNWNHGILYKTKIKDNACLNETTIKLYAK
jgi:hypothetical protein